MDISRDLNIVMRTLSMSENALARELSIPAQRLRSYREGVSCSGKELDAFLDYAYRRGIALNESMDQFFRDDLEKEGNKVLVHSTSREIAFPLDLAHSKEGNDMGRAFYLGERYEQAAAYASLSDEAYVYFFLLDLDGLNLTRYGVDLDWMLAVGYYRGMLAGHEGHPVVKKAIERTLDADVVVCPIADNRMFSTIDEFLEGLIDDVQCIHALSSTNLGMQYALRSGRALSSLTLLRTGGLGSLERSFYRERGRRLHEEGLSKSRLARIEYRGKGRYFGEMLQ